MARTSEYLNEVLGRLAPLDVRGRSMFGGFGVYIDDVMIGLIADDVIYFKTDDSNRNDYEALGSEPFMYTGKRGQPIAMSYHQVPDDVFEEPDEFIAWAEKALVVAKRNKRSKSNKRL